MSTGQAETFQARLQRLEGEHEIRDQDVAERRRAKHARRFPEVVYNLVYVLSFPGALLMGLLGVLMAQYMRFQFTGVPSLNAEKDFDPAILGAYVICGASIWALMYLVRLDGKEQKSAATIGLFAGALGFHNLVFVMPGLFSLVFSPEWVDWITTIAEPYSVYFGGEYYAFGEAPSEA